MSTNETCPSLVNVGECEKRTQNDEKCCLLPFPSLLRSWMCGASRREPRALHPETPSHRNMFLGYLPGGICGLWWQTRCRRPMPWESANSASRVQRHAALLCTCSWCGLAVGSIEIQREKVCRDSRGENLLSPIMANVFSEDRLSQSCRRGWWWRCGCGGGMTVLELTARRSHIIHRSAPVFIPRPCPHCRIWV